MEIRIGKRAQVVIPAELRRRMGVTDGDLLHVDLDEHGRLVLERVEPDPLRRLSDAGRGLWRRQDAVREQREQRAEWPR